MKKFLKKCVKGITLISLVISIIVMIIIATISIDMGITTINSTQDSAIESNLEIVQQAITQQYSKAMTLDKLDIESNINSNNGTNDDTNKPKSFIGTPLKKDELKEYVDKIPQAPDLINVDSLYNYDDTNYEDVYYLISDSELEELGIDVGNGQEYIVNYSTGEVLDVTNKNYTSGDPAYVNGFTAMLDIEKEAFIDTPINITIYEELTKIASGYKFSIKVTDDIAKITPEGVAAGKTPTQDDVEKDPNDLNKNDLIVENMIITGKEPDNKIIDGVSIVKKVIPDSSQDIGEHYIYEFVVAGTKIDPTNPIIKLEILPDSIIDDDENGNSIAELTTSNDGIELEPRNFEFNLDNIKYYAKNLQGEQIQGIKVGNESWGDSATAELILSTTEKNGLNNENYTFDYIWSTTEPIDWKDAKQVTLTPRQGAKNIKTTILIEGNTGKGKLYVKPSTELKTAIGTQISQNMTKSINMNLDGTPPKVEVLYQDENGNEKDINEFLGKKDAFLRIKSDIPEEGYGTVYPRISYSFEDDETGLFPSAEDNKYKSSHIFYKQGQNPREVFDVFLDTFEYTSDNLYQWFTVLQPYNQNNGQIVQDGILKKFKNSSLEFAEKLPSGEYYIAFASSINLLEQGVFVSDNCGNKLEDLYSIGPIKVDSIPPEIKEIKISEDGNANIIIKDDYSGLTADFSKIKYAWTTDSAISGELEWKSVTEEQIKQKLNNTETKNVGEYTINIGYPKDTANYYVAVKLDNYEDIAGNIANSISVSDESAKLEEFEYKVENLEIEAENSNGEKIDGVEIDGELWGKSATFNITLSSTGKNGLKKGSYIFEYIWTTDENYVWNSSETSKASIYLPNAGRETASTSLITLDSYTGEGYLYVRPMQQYTSSSGKTLDTTPQKIKINLDNTPPEFYLKYKNSNGSYENLENVISNSDFYFRKGEFYDQTKKYIKLQPNIVEGLTDSNSGLNPNLYVKSSLWQEIEHDLFDQAFDKENVYAFLVYKDEFFGIMNRKENGPYSKYLERDNATLESVIPDSGKYYCVLMHKNNDIYVMDAVGNKVSEPKIVGPINIDINAPKIEAIISDEYGNAKVQINDDYSGLTTDYSKIKYSWIKSKTSTPTKWNSITKNDISIEKYTTNNKPQEIFAKVNLPTDSGNWYLAVKIEGYEDIAGNKAGSNIFISDEVFGLATDLKIEVYEEEGLADIKDVKIRITSESSRLFKINSISYEHKGLNDKQEIQVGDLEITDEYLTTYYSTVNGPIIVYVESGGKTYTQEYIVKNVQGLILNYEISENEFYLPIWRDTRSDVSALLYVNWDKSKNNDEANYVTENLISQKLVEKDIDGQKQELMEMELVSENAAVHNYQNLGVKQIEITGCTSSNRFLFDYSIQKTDKFNTNNDDNYSSIEEYKYTEKSMDLINEFNRKLSVSRNSLKEIVQFGRIISYKDPESDNINVIDAFLGCKNLIKLPSVINVNFDYNVNFFAQAQNINKTFSETGIYEFDFNLLNKANNLSMMYYTFENCKNLKKFDERTLENCTRLWQFEGVLKGTALEAISENLFKNNIELSRVTKAFEDTPITQIPDKLFKENKALKFADSTFRNTQITQIPDVLFKSNVELFSLESTFRDTKLVEIPARLFVENIELSNLSHIFENTPITAIPENIFVKNKKITELEYSFAGTLVTEISNNIFIPTRESLVSCKGLFERCTYLKLYDKNNNLFKDFACVRNFSYIFNLCGSIEVIPENLFSGCSSVYTFEGAFWYTAIKSVERNVIFGEDVSCRNSVSSAKLMFSNCYELQEVDSLFKDFKKIEDLRACFFDCQELRKVPEDIFMGCINVKYIGGLFTSCELLSELGTNAFDDFYNTIKSISYRVTEFMIDENGITYHRIRWFGVLEGCRSLTESQTPTIYKLFIDREPNTYYNSYYDIGFELDFPGAILYMPYDWEVVNE